MTVMPRKLCAVCLMFFCIGVNANPKPIYFWHSLSGHLGRVLTKICSAYNSSQEKYRIKPIYKGDYIEAMTSFAAAFRAGLAPPLIQIFEVGSATMLSPTGIIKPLYQIVDTTKFDSFLPAIKNYYSDDNGRLLAMPFNSSVPILYYNKTLFKRAGVKHVPSTWEELAQTSQKLKASGIKCAYTTAYPSWIHLEAFSAIHNLTFSKAIANRQLVVYDSPEFITHIQQLVDWKKKKWFAYGGRDSDATALFSSGYCAMLTQSSGSYQSLTKLVGFEVGVAAMPYSKQIINTRHNSIIGGAALWVVNGFDVQTYQGIASFLNYLAMPKIQAYWHQNTGYLPVSEAAIKFNHQTPLASDEIVLAELAHDMQNSRIRLGNYAQIRRINDEELEAAIAGMKPVKQALNDAVARVNHLLKRFQNNVS
jgi:sn-glycerol 3-phosphate transport system substrate-binding protein